MLPLGKRPNRRIRAFIFESSGLIWAGCRYYVDGVCVSDGTVTVEQLASM